MDEKKTNWKKPLITLLIFVTLCMVPALALDIAYNSDYYLPVVDSGMLNASIQQAEEQPKEPVVIIGTITYKKDSPANKQSEAVVKEQIKPQSEQKSKNWICKDPRPLLMGGGTVRECEWE